jgi:hypothetical protein
VDSHFAVASSGKYQTAAGARRKESTSFLKKRSKKLFNAVASPIVELGGSAGLGTNKIGVWGRRAQHAKA